MSKRLLYLLAIVLLLGMFSASAMATDYYLDAVDGDDDICDGSFGDPWKSFANIMSYYQASYRPSGWVNIAPGDTIYLMDGTYDELLYYGGSGGANQNGPYIAAFRSEAGDSGNIYKIKAYPGESPVLDEVTGANPVGGALMGSKSAFGAREQTVGYRIVGKFFLHGVPCQ